jgi:hypothetical protein
MKFFKDSIKNESKLYARIRDYEKDFSIKSQIESFWNKYEPYAPHNFLETIQMERNFHQRWWEMFLGVGLLNLNFKIQTSNIERGPDFKFVLPSKIIWVEAVAPNIGEGEDALPKLQYGVEKLPEKAFLLRLTTSLNSKFEAFNKYKKERIVSENDYCIIGISSCALNQYGSLMNFPAPAPLKAVAGVGNLVLNEDGNYVQYRVAIQKRSGSLVETNLFNLDKFSNVCALLYSHSDPLNSPNKPETTLTLFLNPNNSQITNDLLSKMFYGIEIWYQTQNESYVIWQKETDM